MEQYPESNQEKIEKQDCKAYSPKLAAALMCC